MLVPALAQGCAGHTCPEQCVPMAALPWKKPTKQPQAVVSSQEGTTGSTPPAVPTHPKLLGTISTIHLLRGAAARLPTLAL